MTGTPSLTVTDSPNAPLGVAALAEALRARIEAELAPGERLLWAGQPDPKRPGLPRRKRAASVIWTLAWAFLAVVALPLSVSQAARINPPASEAWILGIVGGVGALVVTFFRSVMSFAMWVEHGQPERRRDNEFYALTDRRVLIWKPVAGSTAVSLIQITPRSVRPATIERIEYPDGSGDLHFSPYRAAQGAIRGIPQVRPVDILVRQVLVDATAPPLFIEPDDSEEPF